MCHYFKLFSVFNCFYCLYKKSYTLAVISEIICIFVGRNVSNAMNNYISTNNIMKKEKTILCILALFCTMVQGAWADTYEYPTKTKPSFYSSYGEKSNVVVINTAA